jgi:hypothetical protein
MNNGQYGFPKNRTKSTSELKSITNNEDDRLVTATGGTSINAEANLTFDGTTLQINGDLSQVGATTIDGTIDITGASVVRGSAVTYKSIADQESFCNQFSYDGEVIEGVLSSYQPVNEFDLVAFISESFERRWAPTGPTGHNADTLLGICISTGSLDEPVLILLRGDITVCNTSSSGTYGPRIEGLTDVFARIYISNGAGQMQNGTTATPGEVVRRLGYTYYRSTADARNFIMRFTPSNDWTIVPG